MENVPEPMTGITGHTTEIEGQSIGSQFSMVLLSICASREQRH